MTDEGRKKRIQEALKAWDEKQGPKETMPLFWHGPQQIFPVIELDIDVPLLNTKSHRLRSQFESDPRGRSVVGEPWSEPAQELAAEYLQRPFEDFERLMQNLAIEGQRQPGVITREGVLMNANRRLVALRKLHDPARRWIRVAVLPSDADPSDLVDLELTLQIQEELKAGYSLTNLLLFIEELAQHHVPQDIALKLRWATNTPASQRKGAADVAQHRRILALIREMQRMVDPPIPLTFFDGKLEHLKALEEKNASMAEEDPRKASRFRMTWLFTALAGSPSVHDLRAVYDEDFVGTYLVPSLMGQELLAPLLPNLLKSAPPSEPDLPGIDELGGEEEAGPTNDDEPDFRRIVSVMSPGFKESAVRMPDGQVLDLEDVKSAVGQGTRSAIDDWRADQRATERLGEPIAELQLAVKHLRLAIVKYGELKDKPEFEQTHRGKFNYFFKRLRKLIRELEDIESGKEAPESRL